MKRHELEHIIRAASDIADDLEIIVIGSQSILASLPDPPHDLQKSVEADVFPKNKTERWNVIDGCIGEGSPFHETFQYYAQGVDRTTARLPKGWEDRLVVVRNENTRYASGLCLEPHDLAIAKWIAGRPKDLEFNKSLVATGILNEDVLLERLAHTEANDANKEMARVNIERCFHGAQEGSDAPGFRL